jgi:hypothetical protein
MSEKYTILSEQAIEIQELSVTQSSENILHKNGLQNNSYTPGSCANDGNNITSDYMKYSSSGNCSDYESKTLNSHDSTCSDYWLKEIQTNDETANNRQLHWLNGGYFYGMSEYRKYIEDELGTIHFSNTIKYDNVYRDVNNNIEIETSNIPQFYLNTKREFKILSDETYLGSIPYMFNIKQSFLSINNWYDLPQKNINSLVPSSLYNEATNKFQSIFKETPEAINNCGYTICPVVAKPSNIIEMDDVFVMLSNGNITYFPLTNENIFRTFYHRIDFTLSTLVQTPGSTYNIDIITPSFSVYDILNNYIGSVQNTSFNSYFVSNAPKTLYGLTTTNVSLAKSSTEFYNNHKFIVYLTKDPDDSTKTILWVDRSLPTVVNEFNEIEDSINGKLLLKDIVSYMKTQYSNIPLTVTLYKFTTTDISTINLNKIDNLLGSGAFLQSAENPTGQFDSDPNLVIKLNDEKNDILDNLYSEYGDFAEFVIMIKATTYLTGFTNNTKNLTQSLSVDLVNNKQLFGVLESADIQLNHSLFDEYSSKFSTPDYSAIKKYDGNSGKKNSIPLRGSEYVESENSNYPSIRYIRKPDGKFYIQVLAGAFPYYHSVVHYPTTRLLTPSGVENPVEKSLKQVCSKSNDWYNHVATTKWTCVIKHTQFGSDSSEYINTEADKSKTIAPQSSIVGSNPPGKKPSVYNPGSIYEGGGISGGSGGGINRPGDGISIEVETENNIGIE